MSDFIEKALAAAEAKRIADEAEKAEAERERLAVRAKRSAEYRVNVLEILAALGITGEKVIETPEADFYGAARWEFSVQVEESLRLEIVIDRAGMDKYRLRLVHVNPIQVAIICEMRKYNSDFTGYRKGEAEEWLEAFPQLLAMLGTEIQNMRAKITLREAELRKTEAEEAARQEALRKAREEEAAARREAQEEMTKKAIEEPTGEPEKQRVWPDGWQDALEYMKRLCERMEKPDARLDAVDRMIIGVVNFCEAVEHNLGTLD